MAVNLMSYSKNVAKSLMYTGIETVADLNPGLKEFAETNADFNKELYSAVKDFKGTIARGQKYVSEHRYFKLANGVRENIIDDLKTGKYYNKEREDAAANAAFEAGDDDWGWSDEIDFDSDSSEELEVDSTDAMLKEMGSSSKAAANAISQATFQSADYVVKSNQEGTRMLMETNKRGFAQIGMGISTVNSNLSAMVTMIGPLSEFMKTSSKFYDEHVSLMKKNNELLDELVKMTKEASVKKAPKSDNNVRDFRSMTSGTGMIDMKAYMKNVGKNIKNNTSMFTSMLDMGGEEFMNALLASPLSFILESGAKKLVSKGMKQNMENMNKTLGNVFASMMLNMNRKANMKGGIWENLNKYLGINMSNGGGYNTEKYKKDKVDFDGIAHKSITEVMPTLLAKILSAVSGEEEMRYDYKAGRFKKVSTISKEVKDIEKRHYRGAGSEFKRSFDEYTRRMKFSKNDKQRLDEGFDQFLKTLYNKGETFQYKNHNVGVEGVSDDVLSVIRAVFSANEQLGRGNINSSLAKGILNERSRQREERERQENGEYSNEVHLKNGSIGYNVVDNKDAKKYYAKMKSHLLTDEKGRDLFYYLQQMYSKLGAINENVIQGGTGGGRGRNRGPAKAAVREVAMPDFKKDGEYKRPKISRYEYHDQTQAKIAEREGFIGSPFANFDSRDIEYNTASAIVNDANLKKRLEEDERNKNKYKGVWKDADTIYKKFQVSKNAFANLVNKPGKFISDMVLLADKRIDDMLFREGDDEDEMGFLELMKRRLNTTFENMNASIDKLTMKATDALKKAMEWVDQKTNDKFGFKVSDLKGYVKDTLFGKMGGDGKRYGGVIGDFVRDTGSNIKSMASSAVGGVKSALTDNDWMNNVPNKARGGRVTRTGIIAVTGGERIIPAPGNKNRQLALENEAKRRFFNAYGTGFDDYGNYATGGNVRRRQIERLRKNNLGQRAKNAWSAGVHGFNEGPIASDGVGAVESEGFNGNTKVAEAINSWKKKAIDSRDSIIDSIFGTEKEADNMKKVAKTTMSELLGGGGSSAAAGALLGGGFSLLTGMIGGPLLGAAVGASAGLISKSDKMQKMLFGEEKDGEYKPGMLPKGVTNFIQKQLPDVAKYGLTGAGAGLLMGHPLIGIMVGSTVGYAKNSENLRHALFGKGAIAEDLDKRIKASIPKIAGGALLGATIGPLGGIIPNAMLGAAAGFVSDTKLFKNVMFGREDQHGKRNGGIMGTLKTSFVDPMAEFAKQYIHDTKLFFQEEVFNPIKKVMEPIQSRVKRGANKLLDAAKKKTVDAAKKFGRGVLGVAKDRLVSTLGKGTVNRITDLAKLGIKVPGAIIKAPFAFAGGVAKRADNKMRERDIEYGEADYMTAEEQLAWMKERGYKDTFQQDINKKFANLSAEDRVKMATRYDYANSKAKNANEYMAKLYRSSGKNIGSSFKSNNIKVSDEVDIRKAILKGDVSTITRRLGKYGMSMDDKSGPGWEVKQVFDEMNTARDNLKDIDKHQGNIHSSILKSFGHNEEDMSDEEKAYFERYLRSQNKLFKSQGVNIINKAFDDDKNPEDDGRKSTFSDKSLSNIDFYTKSSATLLGKILANMTGEDFNPKDLDISSIMANSTTSSAAGMTSEKYAQKVQNKMKGKSGKLLKKAVKAEKKERAHFRNFSSDADTRRNVIPGQNPTSEEEKEFATILKEIADNTKKSATATDTTVTPSGDVIKFRKDKSGDRVPDLRDTGTRQAIAEAKSDDATQESIANSLKNGGLFAGLKGLVLGSDKEKDDKKDGLLSSVLSLAGGTKLGGILEALTGGGLVAGIAKLLGMTGLKTAVGGGLSAAAGGVLGTLGLGKAVTGGYDKTASQMTDTFDQTTYENGDVGGSTLSQQLWENWGKAKLKGLRFKSQGMNVIDSSLGLIKKQFAKSGARFGKAGTILKESKPGELAAKAIKAAKEKVVSNASKFASAAKGTGAKLAEKASKNKYSAGIVNSIKSTMAKMAEKISILEGKFPGITKMVTESSDEIAEAAGKNAVKGTVEGVAKTALKVIGFVATGVFIVADFYDGWQKSDSVWGVTAGKSSTGMKICSGLTNALLNLIPIVGSLISLKFILGIFQKVGKWAVKGIDWKGIEEEQKESSAEVAAYNAQHGTNYDIEDYNKTVKNSGWTIGERIGNSKLGKWTKKVLAADPKKTQTGKKERKYYGAGSFLDAITRDSSKSGAFISQNNSLFKNEKYTANTTLGENGCAPATAAMTANSVIGNVTDMDKAAKYATSKKYATDKGTDARYFKDFLSKFGIGTQYIENTNNGSTSKIKQSLKNGNSVILLGQDSNNKSKTQSPFGKGNHYVVASGYDANGNVIVKDPENSKVMSYDPSILNKVSLGIATNTGRLTSDVIGGYKGGQRNSGGVIDSEYAQKVYAYFTSHGYSPAAAAGILGNLEQESGVDPNSIQGKNRTGPAAGIAQWENINSKSGRWKVLYDYATSKGYQWNDLDPQLNFINGELSGDRSTNPDTYTASLLNKQYGGIDAFKKLTDPKQAAEIFEKVFERSGKSALTDRLNYAAQYYNMYSGSKYTGNYTASAPTGTSSLAEATSGTTDSSKTTSSGSITDVMSTFASSAAKAVAKAFGVTLSGVNGLLGTSFGGDNDATTTDTTKNSNVSSDNTDLSKLTGTGSSKLITAARSKIGKLSYSQSNRNIDAGSGDCSSYTQWVYKKALGIDPGGDSGSQYNNSAGVDVSVGKPDLSQLHPGDLLFYKRAGSNKTDGVGHVEMYEGDGKSLSNGGPTVGAKEKSFTTKDFLKAKRFVASGSRMYDNKSSLYTGSGTKTRQSNNASSTSMYYGGSTTDTATANSLVDNIKTKAASKSTSDGNVANMLQTVIKHLAKISSNTDSNAKILDLFKEFVNSSASGNDDTTTAALKELSAALGSIATE